MESGRFYHVYNRGNNKENIFKESSNYDYFLMKYDKYLTPYVDTYAYCLMPNHFHFLIRVKEMEESLEADSKLLTPIEKAFRDFFISYAKSINKKYERTGSLFQYKYKRKLIEDEEYLNNLVIYIHLNPVVAKYCEKSEGWKYSSYNSMLSDGPTKIKREEVMSWFDNRDNFEYCHQDKLIVQKIDYYLVDELGK